MYIPCGFRIDAKIANKSAQGPATNLVVVSDLFTGTGSSFTFTPAATLTPGTYALGIYDASTYNFWPYFDLAAATTSASTSTPMTASSTSSSTTTQLQPQYVPSSYSSAAVSTPTMTSPPVTTSTMIATTPATMSTFPVSIGAPAPLYQNTTVTTTECSCTDSSTPTAVGGVPTIVSSMPWSSNSSYSATWSPSTTVPALSASVSPSASPASSASVSPSVSPYQPGNSGGSVNSASGLVSAFGVIALAIWCF